VKRNSEKKENEPGLIAGFQERKDAQQVRRPDVKLRPSLSLRPQFGAGCG